MSEITMQTVCTGPHQTSRWTETVNLPFTRPTIHPLLQTIYYHCIYTITHTMYFSITRQNKVLAHLHEELTYVHAMHGPHFVHSMYGAVYAHIQSTLSPVIQTLCTPSSTDDWRS